MDAVRSFVVGSPERWLYCNFQLQWMRSPDDDCEFLPAWILKVPLLRWTNTATFHSLRHTRSRGNFGLHTRLWDRLFGTEVADYELVFIERGRRAASPAVRGDGA